MMRIALQEMFMQFKIKVGIQGGIFKIIVEDDVVVIAEVDVEGARLKTTDLRIEETGLKQGMEIVIVIGIIIQKIVTVIVRFAV